MKKKYRLSMQMAAALTGLLLLTGCAKKETVELRLVETAESRNPEGAEAVKSTEEEKRPKTGQNAEETQKTVWEETAIEESETSEQNKAEAVSVCYVHICGEVKKPGVYRMEAGDRIYQAVEMAGGFTKEAAIDYVNQAEKVQDGLKIRIPSVNETEKNAGQQAVLEEAGTGKGLEYAKDKAKEAGSEKAAGLVNINTADEAELCTLKGIGKSRAQAIIAYRTEQGSFSRKEDIMKVNGIKESSYEKIKDNIIV